MVSIDFVAQACKEFRLTGSESNDLSNLLLHGASLKGH